MLLTPRLGYVIQDYLPLKAALVPWVSVLRRPFSGVDPTAMSLAAILVIATPTDYSGQINGVPLQEVTKNLGDLKYLFYGDPDQSIIVTLQTLRETQ